MTAVLESCEKLNVGMGQISLGRAGAELVAVLGSCVGVAMWHPRHRFAVFAHIVLPASSGRTGLVGKFADTAIPEMLKMIEREGLSSAGFVAKLAGGANMFGNQGGPLQIGAANIDAVTALLEGLRVPIAAKDLGGAKGRRVAVDCRTGQVHVEIVGVGKIIL